LLFIYLFIFQCRAKMPELLQILDIPENSNLATMMMRTMSQCEESDVRTGSAGGHKTCVTSLEDMRQFVYTSLSPEDVSDISPLDRTTISSGSRPRPHHPLFSPNEPTPGHCLFRKQVACRHIGSVLKLTSIRMIHIQHTKLENT
jgi:hypothetical protein